ncbi:GspH/FimT family pseudopilin [Reinekea sp. G2M2-21]|uniref:GspH/FimT family pseudopilin n=1 Tax=Reinekea sp. G2M2-21 TaxID=2788942 RepID=UPI0018A8BE76|nr:GspH/FimT family pseudopilin [Reinekea sp. G2M2-21]
MRFSKGYTIVELMITVGIFAVISAMAYPQYQNLVMRNGVDKVRDDLYVDMVLARSEALSRNRRVTMCATTNPMAMTPVCTFGAADWNTGWIIFADTDGDQILDASIDANGDGNLDTPADELIRVYANKNAVNMTLRYAAFNTNYMTFDRLGRLENTTNGSFWACSGLAGYSAALVVNRTGRPYYEEGDMNEC